MSDKNWPNWLPIRSGLKGMSAYGAPQLPTEVKLNTNENPFTLSKELVEKILNKIKLESSTLNRYPDRDAVRLRTLLASFINGLSGTKINKDNIWAANGSNEIIQSIFLAFGERGALAFEPSYSVHKIIAKVTGTNWIVIDRNTDFSLNIAAITAEIEKSKPSITFLTTPNNPTGTSTSIDEIKLIAQAMKKVNGLLIIDEAYAEFSKLESAVTLIDEFENIIVIRTMSKAFAFAGVRLGYLVAKPEVIEAIMLVRLPAELVSMGLKVMPTEANFILFSGFKGSTSQIWQALVEHGVLVRDVGLPGYLRVTVGTEAENRKFVTELKLLVNGDKK